jgi:predicted ATP-dependent serine protease
MFVCTGCGGQHVQYRPECAFCTAGVNTLVWNEGIADDAASGSPAADGDADVDLHFDLDDDDDPEAPDAFDGTIEGFGRPRARAVRLADVEVRDVRRRSCGIPEIDRILGGGIVDSEGLPIVVWGNPGSGKSRLLTEILIRDAADNDLPALYASGEEDPERVAAYARILDLPLPRSLYIEGGRDFRAIMARARSLRVRAMVFDSLQTFVPDERHVAARVIDLIALARDLHAVVWIVNHANKQGQFYGRNRVKHEFDTTIKIERQSVEVGGKTLPTNLVHAAPDGKNRWGDVAAPAARFQFDDRGRLRPLDEG